MSLRFDEPITIDPTTTITWQGTAVTTITAISPTTLIVPNLTLPAGGTASLAYSNIADASGNLSSGSMTLNLTAWQAYEIGSNANVGSWSYDNGDVIISTNDEGTGKTSDEFLFLAQSASTAGWPAPVALTAHLSSSVTSNRNAQSGLMLRTSADPDAPYVAIVAAGDGHIRMRFRSEWGAPAVNQRVMSRLRPPIDLRVVAIDDHGWLEASVDGGETWTGLNGRPIQLERHRAADRHVHQHPPHRH